MKMLRRLVCGGLCALMLLGSLSVQAVRPPQTLGVDIEEFNGPMPGWANVKQFGAVGDGVADDTAAFQAAINALGVRKVFGTLDYHPEFYVPGSPTTLYIPAGVYRISSTLSIQHRFSVSLVGEHPTTTRIKWGGSAGGTMLMTDGNLAGIFQRLTWDGSGLAAVGVGHWFNSYKATPGDRHGGSTHHIDEVFTDLQVGIYAGCCTDGPQTIIRNNRPGTFVADEFGLRVDHKAEYISDPLAYWAYADYGQMDSEGSVIRVKFIRNSVSGIQAGSHNALNWWVVDSRFEDCYNGLSNNPGAGNFLVYRSTFLRSANADANLKNTQFISMHENVSYGSKYFFRSEEMGDNGAAAVLKNNRIIPASSSHTPIYSGNLGPLILIDNEIKSPVGSIGPVVEQGNWAPGRYIFSIGNSFTVSNEDRQIQMRYDSYSETYNPVSRKRAIDDHVVSRDSISDAIPDVPSVPLPVVRPIFTVPVTVSPPFVYEGQTITEPVSTGAAIQATIDQALAASVPEGAIVYLPAANYVISTPIHVPAGKRIQIRGDGWHTSLIAADSFQGQAIWVLDGPSLATLKDFWVLARSATAVFVDNADQDGGSIYLSGYAGGTLAAKGLMKTRLASLASSSFSVATLSNVANFLSVGQNFGTIEASDNSQVAVFDSWKEASGPSILKTDQSTTAILNGLFAMQRPDHTPLETDTPSIELNRFSGGLSFVGSGFDMAGSEAMPENHAIVTNEEIVPVAQGEVGTNVLLLGVSSNRSDSFRRLGTGGNVGFTMLREKNEVNPNLNSVPDVGDVGDARVRDGLKQIRNVRLARTPNVAAVGATDLRFYRVYAMDTARGVVIQGNTRDCLTSDGNVQLQGTTSAVSSIVVVDYRPATAAECPQGGQVPLLAAGVNQYVCEAGKLNPGTSMISTSTTEGAPVCAANPR